MILPLRPINRIDDILPVDNFVRKRDLILIQLGSALDFTYDWKSYKEG